MLQLTLKKNKLLEANCAKVLGKNGIRFCGVINKMGHLDAGGFKKGIDPYEKNENHRTLYLQIVLDANMRNEYNETLGPIEYISSKRGKITMISIPILNYIVLVSAEPNLDVVEIVNQIRTIFMNDIEN